MTDCYFAKELKLYAVENHKRLPPGHGRVHDRRSDIRRIYWLESSARPADPFLVCVNRCYLPVTFRLVISLH